MQHLIETYGYAFLFSLTGYLGIQFVLTLVRTCGAPLAATVTTARKAVTMALSFVFFTKPFSMQLSHSPINMKYSNQIVIDWHEYSIFFAHLTMESSCQSTTSNRSHRLTIISMSHSFRYVWCGLIVVLGIYLNVYSKKNKMTFSEGIDKLKQLYGRLRGEKHADSAARRLLINV